MTKQNQPTIPLEASRRMQLAKTAGVSLALFLAACGGGEAITTSSAATEPAANQAAASESAASESAETESVETDVAGASTEAESATSSDATVSPEEAAAAATENMGLLTSVADSVFDIEVLSVSNGQITTLNDVVDGDRPVLLWFWSPH